jgi:hypothetical protein
MIRVCYLLFDFAQTDIENIRINYRNDSMGVFGRYRCVWYLVMYTALITVLTVHAGVRST